MTDKLYYQDSEIAEAKVRVIHSGSDEKGYYAVLNQTCFYPEGGGQPADRGIIGKAKVLDVQTVKDEIRHYTDIPLNKESFLAEIDWARRFDHMQQHAGQHVLSAVFDDVYEMKTQSFHLGEDRVSIDLDAKEISEIQLEDVEAKANRVIRRHIPIETEWVTEQQAAERQLRKPPAVKGDIRLVTIAGIDINACGGTHPKNTADLNVIKIISTEKAKGGTRVYFLCGSRAMEHFQFLIETNSELIHKLNAPAAGLTEAAEALLKEKAANEKELKELRFKLLEAEAAAVKPEGETVEKIFHGRPFKEVQQLAKLVIAGHPSAFLLFLAIDGNDIRFVCARGENASGDMRQPLKELLALTEGKGGGNLQFAQGGGRSTEPVETFVETFREALRKIQ